jgi:hypothetical protein
VKGRENGELLFNEQRVPVLQDEEEFWRFTV